MKAKELLAALALPIGVAEKTSGLSAILTHIKFDKGKATANNLVTAVEVAFAGPDLKCCVPALRLRDALNSIPPDAEVKLNRTANSLVVSSARMRHTMPTMPVEDMPLPKWPEGSKPIADWPALLNALEYAASAACVNDHAMPQLNGVGSQDSNFVSSNRHSALRAAGESPFPDDVIIPATVVPKIAKLPTVTAYGLDESRILTFIFEGGRFSTPLLEGQFPRMDRILPSEHGDIVFDIERPAFDAAVKAIRGVQHADWLKVSIGRDLLVLEDETPEGSARVEVVLSNEKVTAEYGINSDLLANVVTRLDGPHLRISQKAEGSPIYFTGAKASRAALVMPAKL